MRTAYKIKQEIERKLREIESLEKELKQVQETESDVQIFYTGHPWQNEDD